MQSKLNVIERPEADVAELAARMRGSVVTPADEGWDEARQAWNLAVDQRPELVAFAETAEDVAAVVAYAAEHGLRVAPQGTGHNAAALGSLEGTILLKTSRMRGVSIDPERRIARVEAGTLWMDVVAAAAPHGLVGLSGSSPDVGVVGYTLGGGLSWYGRKHGLASSNVTAVELVTADGRIVRATADEEADLFWAVRGGGGSFGVVTAIELRLFPLEQVYAGILWFPYERAAEVLHAWREYIAEERPDELTTVGRLLQLPPLEEIPEPVRGKSFAIVEVIHLGDEEEGARLIEPLRALGPVMDTVATIPVPALSHLHMDPEHPVPGAGDGDMLAELPAEAIDAVLAAAGPGTGSSLLSVELRQLGGAIARPLPGHGVLASIDAAVGVYAVGIAPTPELKARAEADAKAVLDALAPWIAPKTYMNFIERREDARRFVADESFERLQQIKAAVDPDDVIRGSHPIAAAR